MSDMHDPTGLGRLPDDNKTRFSWVPDPSSTLQDLESVAEALRAGGADAEIEEARGLVVTPESVPILISGIMAIPTLVNAVLALVRRSKPGLIVDTTSGSVVFREDSHVPGGKIVAITKGDTKVTIEDLDRDGIPTLTQVLAGLAHNH
jgi:hypothetical protein